MRAGEPGHVLVGGKQRRIILVHRFGGRGDKLYEDSGAISGLSNNLVFYLISGSDAYILQNDTGTEIDGVMSKQP